MISSKGARPETAISHRPRSDKALRASENSYRRLFETAQDGIAILDAATGQINDANPFLLDMLGYTLPEMKSRTIWEIGPLEDVDRARTTFDKLKNELYVRYENLPLETKDGRKIAVEFVSNIYPVNAGMVVQCNIRSIAARKKAEADWRQSVAVNQATTEAAERARLTRQIHDTVIQSISLANIKLGSVAKMMDLAELENANRELKTVRELLQESLAQCRLVMSDLTPPMLYELGLVPALEDLIGTLHTKHGAQISLEADEIVKPADRVASSLLFDAARELIINAMKHAGPCAIHCTLRQRGADLQLVVMDNGFGFDATASRYHEEAGQKGFGLFNTRERIEGMGGQLEIHSKPGVGTVATITMPLERREDMGNRDGSGGVPSVASR